MWAGIQSGIRAAPLWDLEPGPAVAVVGDCRVLERRRATAIAMANIWTQWCTWMRDPG